MNDTIPLSLREQKHAPELPAMRSSAASAAFAQASKAHRVDINAQDRLAAQKQTCKEELSSRSLLLPLETSCLSDGQARTDCAHASDAGLSSFLSDHSNIYADSSFFSVSDMPAAAAPSSAPAQDSQNAIIAANTQTLVEKSKRSSSAPRPSRKRSSLHAAKAQYSMETSCEATPKPKAAPPRLPTPDVSLLFGDSLFGSKPRQTSRVTVSSVRRKSHSRRVLGSDSLRQSVKPMKRAPLHESTFTPPAQVPPCAREASAHPQCSESCDGKPVCTDLHRRDSALALGLSDLHDGPNKFRTPLAASGRLRAHDSDGVLKLFSKKGSSSNDVKDAMARQAFREKVASCIVIGALMVFVAFITFGMQLAFCPSSGISDSADAALDQTDHVSLQYRDGVVINGYIYHFNDVSAAIQNHGGQPLSPNWHGMDITSLFQPMSDACAEFPLLSWTGCTHPSGWPGSPSPVSARTPCAQYNWIDGLLPTGRLYFTWTDISLNARSPNTLTAFNGAVLNLTAYNNLATRFAETSTGMPPLSFLLPRVAGSDATLSLSSSTHALTAAKCFRQLYLVGYVDAETVGCTVTRFVQNLCLAVILILILVRFVMAIYFYWFMAHRAVRDRSRIRRSIQRQKTDAGVLSGTASSDIGSADVEHHVKPPFAANDPFCILLVTCYSESEAGIAATLESLAAAAYPNSRKLLFVVADGLVRGADNPLSTPEAILKMVEPDHEWGRCSEEALSYLAVADGARTHNLANVHAGYYRCANGDRVPIVVVVKCGTPSESATTPKPGNRGKRDSQVILMRFLHSVITRASVGTAAIQNGSAMTQLDHALYRAIRIITGFSPEIYELVLMVDADTVMEKDALRYMVLVMSNDERVMGLCGETRIANKDESWITKIQVFEYYISHHLGKAFESSFGGVTCLPGCFCMYRIKARAILPTKGKWIVPLLASGDIISEYSVAQVDTLHKKNLLCLGEDRYLTTLMLRQFPRRKLVFVPKALCHTTVPADFKTLRSQRRRWINSTIHNLLELVFMKNLCGIFCFSMQFVILLELIGTLVLPAAIAFMYILIFSAIFGGKLMLTPLLTLMATLGLPAVLICITSREWEYITWMMYYLAALPIWNFVLPLYSFWHLDDVTWGETRKVEGETVQTDHSGKDGEYEAGAVPVKTYAQWEADRLQRLGRNDKDLDSGPAITHICDITALSVHEIVDSLKAEMASPNMNPDRPRAFAVSSTRRHPIETSVSVDAKNFADSNSAAGIIASKNTENAHSKRPALTDPPYTSQKASVGIAKRVSLSHMSRNESSRNVFGKATERNGSRTRQLNSHEPLTNSPEPLTTLDGLYPSLLFPQNTNHAVYDQYHAFNAPLQHTRIRHHEQHPSSPPILPSSHNHVSKSYHGQLFSHPSSKLPQPQQFIAGADIRLSVGGHFQNATDINTAVVKNSEIIDLTRCQIIAQTQHENNQLAAVRRLSLVNAHTASVSYPLISRSVSDIAITGSHARETNRANSFTLDGINLADLSLASTRDAGVESGLLADRMPVVVECLRSQGSGAEHSTPRNSKHTVQSIVPYSQTTSSLPELPAPDTSSLAKNPPQSSLLFALDSGDNKKSIDSNHDLGVADVITPRSLYHILPLEPRAPNISLRSQKPSELSLLQASVSGRSNTKIVDPVIAPAAEVDRTVFVDAPLAEESRVIDVAASSAVMQSRILPLYPRNVARSINAEGGLICENNAPYKSTVWGGRQVKPFYTSTPASSCTPVSPPSPLRSTRPPSVDISYQVAVPQTASIPVKQESKTDPPKVMYEYYVEEDSYSVPHPALAENPKEVLDSTVRLEDREHSDSEDFVQVHVHVEPLPKNDLNSLSHRTTLTSSHLNSTVASTSTNIHTLSSANSRKNSRPAISGSIDQASRRPLPSISCRIADNTDKNGCIDLHDGSKFIAGPRPNPFRIKDE